MKIVSAYRINNLTMIVIECKCGRDIHHKSTDNNIKCDCGNTDNLPDLKEEFLRKDK